MKKTLQDILGAKVDPVFFAFSCLLLIIVLATAQAFVQDIMKVSDNVQYIPAPVFKK
jgi:hypothetical protein